MTDNPCDDMAIFLGGDIWSAGKYIAADSSYLRDCRRCERRSSGLDFRVHHQRWAVTAVRNPEKIYQSLTIVSLSVKLMHVGHDPALPANRANSPISAAVIDMHVTPDSGLNMDGF